MGKSFSQGSITTTANIGHSINYRKCPYIKAAKQSHCKLNEDCPDGYSCCTYFMKRSFCVPTNPNICYKNGRAIPYLTVITQKNCLRCTCLGSDSWICNPTSC